MNSNQKKNNYNSDYMVLFNKMHTAVLLIDPSNAAIIDANPAASKFYGWSKEELQKKYIYDINTLGKKDVLVAINIAKGQKPFFRILKHKLADNSIHDVEVHIDPIEINGKTLLVSMIYDIAEKVDQKNELQNNINFQKSIFRVASTGIGVVKNRIITQVNEQLCKMTGYKENELIGKPSRILYADNKSSQYAGKERYRDIEEQGAGTVETVLQRKDETLFDVLLSSTPINPNDLNAGVIFTALDITAQKQNERKLRENEENFRITLNSIGDGVISTDTKGIVTRLNTVAAKLIDWQSNEAIGKPIDDVFNITNAKTGENIISPIQMVINTERILEFGNHTILISKSGREYQILGSATPIKSKNRLMCVVLVFRDVTKKYAMEKELLNSQRLFNTIMNTIPDLVSIHNKNMEIEYSNWKDLGNIPLERRKIGAKCFKTYHNFNDRCPNCMAKNVIISKQQLQTEVELPDGKWFNIRVIPIIDENDNCERLVEFTSDITKRKRTEQTMEINDQRLRAVFDNVKSVAILGYNRNREVVYCNKASQNLYDYTADEAIGHRLEDLIIPENMRQNFINSVENWYKRNIPIPTKELTLRKKGGDTIQVYSSHVMIENCRGENELYSIDVDFTERRKVEEEKELLQIQLLQTQKMESIGRLAGGVAHDFNNMLGAILGYAELELEKITSDHPLYDGLIEIQKAGNRSAELTKQLLAFARKQIITPKTLDLNNTIENMLRMLRRLIDEDIELNWQPAPNCCSVLMDPSQLDQILANLCINAQDAVSKNGTITIQTKHETIEPNDDFQISDIEPGKYIVLTVCDNGHGMDNDKINQIFEPFFTTKPRGKGTGLGLATVYGIVKQNHGYIHVYSELGKGTIFNIYLPEDDTKSKVKHDISEPIKMATEIDKTILLVEDEPALLDLTTKMLTRLGYSVIATESPKEAITVAKKYTHKIYLLMTDIVMPSMNGDELSKVISPICPHSKLLFMSGYTADIIADHGIISKDINFIQKPFTLKLLSDKLQKILNE